MKRIDSSASPTATPSRPRAWRGIAVLLSLLLVPVAGFAEEPSDPATQPPASQLPATQPAAELPAALRSQLEALGSEATPEQVLQVGQQFMEQSGASPEESKALLDTLQELEGLSAEAQAEADLAHDLSPWGMYQNADVIVKGVMIGLAIASVFTWTIWIAKGFELLGAKRRLRRELLALKQARTLKQAGEIGQAGSLSHLLIQDALEEVHLSANTREKEGIKERVSFRLERLVAASGRQMSQGTGVLATIGSTAPFVGLFGTVWGIMNSFIGIAKSQTTNLAVVAPGIAEALLATALGLVAAIPAVVIYNVFARSIAGYKAQVADASAQVLLLVSRDLDQPQAAVERSQPHVVKVG